jgi:hypothetical protein
MLALGYSNATYVYDDERALRDALVSARDAHCQVDLYLLVLGGFPYSSIMDGFAPRAPPALRLVYDTGGSDLRDGHHWVERGAKVFIGHRGNNAAPIFYAFFLPALLRGNAVDDAVASANRITRALLLGGTLGSSAGNELWLDTEAHVVDGELGVP